MGRAAAGPGIPCADIDKAARTVIDKSGYGKYFTHRVGHGIGMEGHEEPYMRGDNMQLLEPGMAFTVEPGIYLPNRNGVRIEDNVVITESGAESLSDSVRRNARMIGFLDVPDPGVVHNVNGPGRAAARVRSAKRRG